MHVLPLIALVLVSLQTSGVSWPDVVAQSRTFRVDLSAEKIVIDAPITDQAGRELYHFACRGGGQAYVDSLSGNWVAPLMCTLAPGQQAREESLLSEDGSAAWFSRGQFKAEELVGVCARYPEFGVHRSFRLRGFRLNLDAQNVVAGSDGLAKSFTLVVSVVRDPTARSRQAERPGYLDPRGKGHSCEVVRRGREPRMCRDASGSFALCKD
jgi:hypothetical protein